MTKQQERFEDRIINYGIIETMPDTTQVLKFVNVKDTKFKVIRKHIKYLPNKEKQLIHLIMRGCNCIQAIAIMGISRKTYYKLYKKATNTVKTAINRSKK